MTTITNDEAVPITTIEQIQTWMVGHAISITTSISLSIDQMGYVKDFTTDETLTEDQITSFRETFLNKRFQGNMGADVTSSQTITLTQGNLFSITGTTTIDYITTSGWKTGSIVCLKFLAGTIQLTHDATSVPAITAAMFLSTSSNGLFSAGSVLTLIYDGEYWREISRMVI